MTKERRQFQRVLYRAPALVTQGQKRVATTVQDLSLHGALLSIIDEPILDSSKPVDIEFPLPESDIVIQLTANIIQMTDSTMRVSIDHIDIDSIAHLRRLVELNIGDDSLLHRELEHLIEIGDDE
ncbi:PilZ domain-containing protein [Vibrio sp.]|uniref:Cyclic diguanosine monophosphate-binding protein n=1 Tax=Vibrio viridaestus TaxID=2487322 RepID=A0A3N9THT4_9VIBR|nr:PilZ domain-containing protein [Vibrio viridaestus]MDC0612674.1 PilZ domain-containing protein [Vibrio sp.]RQW63075.1 PilZ domain-containing protein [Vibrio viridaestus]